MFELLITVKDNVSSAVFRWFRRIPVVKRRLLNEYVSEAKTQLVEVTNEMFGGGNRLAAGVKSRDISDSEVGVYIEASGKPGTTGAEKLVEVLNRGTIHPHPIFPRNAKVLAMDKGPEGTVFRKFVRAHSVRPHGFFEIAEQRLIEKLKARKQADIRLIETEE